MLQSDPYWPLKDSLLISIKACVLFLFEASFEKLESGTIRVDPYFPFRKI